MSYQIVMEIEICSGSGNYAFLHKVFDDSNIIPIPGIYVEDPAWKEPRKPIEITCNFDDKSYFLRFQFHECRNDEECERQCEMYKQHGWRILR